MFRHNISLKVATGVLGFVPLLHAAELTPQLLTRNQVLSVRQFLEKADNAAHEKEAFQNPDFYRRVVAYYLAGTNRVPTRAKLWIGAFLSGEERYFDAIKPLKEYVQTYSNDWQGLTLLGRSLIHSGAYGRAIPVLTNAAAQIHTKDPRLAPYEAASTYSLLAKAALFAGRSEIIGDIAPELLQLTPEEFITDPLRLHATYALLAYAIGIRDESLFVRTVREVSLEQVLASPDLWECAQLGCYLFSTKALEPLRLGLRDGAEKPAQRPATRERIPITIEEAEFLRQELRNNDEGKTDLYAKGNPELCRQLVAYYFARTNTISTKAKLPISRCMGMGGYYPEAVMLAEEYLQVYSNDWRAWRIVGLAAYQEKSYGQACNALTNAIAYPEAADLHYVLAVCALMSGRLEIVREVAATLLKQRDTAERDTRTKIEITHTLIYCAVATKDRELFLKSLDGLSAEEILSSEYIRTSLFIAHNFFEAKEVEPLWQAYQRAATDQQPKRR